MADYVTEDGLRAYIGSESTNFASILPTICTVASRGIDGLCGRYFSQDAAVSVRYFDPDDPYCTPTDDISTTTGLIVATDDAANGGYSTAWTLDTDYFLEPVNQRQGPVGGWPYTEITALNTRWFARNVISRRPLVKVTARWGWAAVPDQITHAALIAAARLFKMKDAADGFIGLDGWGPVRVKENPEVRALCGPFIRNPVVVV